ncbi:MAG: hypothetical protein QNJ12_05845 [Ilumatobacter sp.]|uniref:hypothetical protein n=1 Tax=Ilumatobacter sp. TaxID=1967498 RepID=UPI002611491D|nr:hypothetical protein [Ilumatobacter sp.]MDJ0768294.1 hypothetical protein [Ilumatobacter sp.]
MKLYSTSDPTTRPRPARVDYCSRAWEDAIGTGYQISPSRFVLDIVARQNRRGYCSTHRR